MAFLTIFTAITLEGWTDTMYALNASWGISVFNALYFIFLIMFGSFFLLNFALAVIWDEYEKAEQSEAEAQDPEPSQTCDHSQDNERAKTSDAPSSSNSLPKHQGRVSAANS